MYILDSNPFTLIKRLRYGPSNGKLPTNLEHSQETFFLDHFFVRPEILNCRPVALGNRDRFAKVYFFLKMSKF